MKYKQIGDFLKQLESKETQTIDELHKRISLLQKIIEMQMNDQYSDFV